MISRPSDFWEELRGRAFTLLARHGRPDPEYAEIGMIVHHVDDYVLTGMVIPRPYVTVRHKGSPYTQFDSRPEKEGVTLSDSEWGKMMDALRKGMVLDDLARL